MTRRPVDQLTRKQIAIMKKIYNTPQTEVMQLETSVIMEAFGPASAPKDPFASAPKRRTKVF
jgi:hypothetical protein